MNTFEDEINQRGSYPRPQFFRPEWSDLSGTWQFAFDDADEGVRQAWNKLRIEHAAGASELPASSQQKKSTRAITVPFPPESPMSGIAETGHEINWYFREITPQERKSAGFSAGRRLLLHFGAVDYQARVWCNGELVATHEGGHAPFTADITEQAVEAEAADADASLFIVLRSQDRIADVSKPRGKQDWRAPHDIWYENTSGIWQPVWLEAVAEVSIENIFWKVSPDCSNVDFDVELSGVPQKGTCLAIELTFEGETVASGSIEMTDELGTGRLTVRQMWNGQHQQNLLWSPDKPRLLDATVTLSAPASDAENDGGVVLDRVQSYLGLRTVGINDRAFLLNDRPCYVRSVLEQGYWRESHLAAPSSQALREEVEHIKSLGFNAVRIHQKIGDPRFLYWADRLGLLVWGEMPAAYEFTTKAMTRSTAEWTEEVLRDRSHPSIVTWVPLNESWGVQHISTSPAQRAFSRGICDLTRALDPTRPVISNDGWEHTHSDIITIHDYSQKGSEIIARYGSLEAVNAMIDGYGPQGRLVYAEPLLEGGEHAHAHNLPMMISEFGGVEFAVNSASDSWGYATATSADDYRRRLKELFAAVYHCSAISGFCYTQLTDTRQEANGLMDENRVPKLPVEEIHDIVMGKAE
ncbi:MAG: hypothetical protein LKI93_06040 [Bifidobacteriaceae bacterium]|jgi:beta-galactosidase/beta-glucuronidase|nr:hypothetical protein [Bifidobacteriaceae bacterium]MCI1914360.1 hypothetical protein [Bifidobacteriaceae bacterium]